MPIEPPLDLLAFHAYLLRNDRYGGPVMRPYAPLSPACLVAYLRVVGYAVDFFDPTLQPDDTSFEVALSRGKPRVAALFGHPSTREQAWRLIGACRRHGCVTLAFGDDPAAVPDLYLEHGLDLVVRGEAELVTAQVLEHLRGHGHRLDLDALEQVPSLTFRRGDETVHTAEATELLDLETAPPPLRDEVQTRAYLQRRKEVHGVAELPLVTSRGFPGTPAYRRRIPEGVAAEIAELRQRYELDGVRFVDHVFTADHPWHTRFAEALESRGGPMPYECLGRVQDIDRALLETMKAAGCTRITFDLGTGSRRLLRQLDRGYRIEDIYRVARLLRELEVEFGALVSLGLEGETRDDVLATIDMIKVLEPDLWGLTLEDPEIAAIAHEIKAIGVPGMRTLVRAWPDPERPIGRRLPTGFYRWALRLMTADTHLYRSWRQGDLDLAAVGAAVARPLYRAMVAAYPVRAR